MKKKKILKAISFLNKVYLNDLKLLNNDIENLKMQLRDFEYRKYLILLFIQKKNLKHADFMGFLSQKIVDPYIPSDIKNKIQKLYSDLLKRGNDV